MDRTFPLSPDEAEVAYYALRYYASELFEAYLSDDESPMLDEAASAEEMADRLQLWLVANRQSLLREAG